MTLPLGRHAPSFSLFPLPSRLRRGATAAVLATVLVGCSKPEPAKLPAEPSVAADTVSFPDQKEPVGVRLAVIGGQTSQTLRVPGRLVWDEDRTTRVYAPFGGRVERLRVAVGETVRRGQPLADLASGDIGQAQAELHKAQADLTLTRASLERARELSEGGVIARKELQQAEAENLRAEAESARVRARLAQYGVASQSVTQGLSLAAPLAGVVVERNGNPGTEVRADVQGPPLFTISDPTSLWALLDVDEKELAAFKPGDTVDLASAAWPDVEFRATITSVAASVDPSTRAVKVRARVPNPQQRLKADMYVTATAIQPVALPAVPADAVFLRGERTFVFVRSGPGRYQRREVKLRGAGPATWMALQGVVVGDAVVVGGGLYLDQLLDTAK